jgi:thioredoxin-related protein
MFLKTFLYLFLLTPIGLAAQDKGVHFEHDLSWSQVKAKAKAENKYIFMDCSTTWCINCAYMTSTIFPMEEMGTFFNDKFISVHVQMDSTAQDPENIKRWYADVRVIKSKYPISGYPTFLYFSPGGELVHRVLGSAGAKEFITQSAGALDPDKQLYTLLKKY